MPAKETRSAAEKADADKVFGLKTKKKAEYGDPEAMFELGEMISNGTHGFEKDKKLGFHWNVVQGAILSARNGSGNAFYLLGVYYSWGKHGFPKDKKEAKRWFAKSLEASEQKCKDKAESALKGLEDEEEE